MVVLIGSKVYRVSTNQRSLISGADGMKTRALEPSGNRTVAGALFD
jgi:hypothetical protein